MMDLVYEEAMVVFVSWSTKEVDGIADFVRVVEGAEASRTEFVSVNETLHDTKESDGLQDPTLSECCLFSLTAGNTPDNSGRINSGLLEVKLLITPLFRFISLLESGVKAEA